MAIPFLHYFKKKPKAEPVAAPAPVAAPKAAGERMSKTVMPSAPRSVTPQPAPAPVNTYAQTSAAPAPVPAPAPVAPRTVSFGGPVAAGIPPAVALALEPNIERTISVDLADVVNQMPEGFVRQLQNGDSERRILLKASELERGMANGKPAVSIASIYEQVPEIFVRPVSPTDPAQVALPFSVVLEQFSNLQTRGDQQRATSVPQVQTPFLQVTLEDDQRFGTRTDLSDGVDLPTVRVEPATAESLAAAEPEPALREPMPVAAPANAPGKPFSLRPAVPGPDASPAAATPPPVAPARIPFKITPNGTGVPAPERVPASSEPSVPTSSPTEPAAPQRIPFKVSAPSEQARPKGEPWLTKASYAAGADTAPAPALTIAAPTQSDGAATISLELKPILEMLPPMQQAGDPEEVPGDLRIELPFSLVEPQLVTGRVSIEPDVFAAALPEQFRGWFNASETAVPVSLPLQQVLQNLPTSSLRMRDDQEEQEKGANFETPFSAKAAEDAKRMKVAATPVAKPTVVAPAATAAPAPTPVVASAPIAAPVLDREPLKMAAAAPEVAPILRVTEQPKSGERTGLQTALDTDDELDAKAVVAHVGKMDGIEACAIMFGDGLSLAGNLPQGYEAEGLCAMAPSMLQRIENHMVETQLGALRAMTLSCAKAAITFFMHDNLCLAALHAKEELAADVRDRLGRTVEELSRQYSHPA